jgi:hypothetical protein
MKTDTISKLPPQQRLEKRFQPLQRKTWTKNKQMNEDDQKIQIILRV